MSSVRSVSPAPTGSGSAPASSTAGRPTTPLRPSRHLHALGYPEADGMAERVDPDEVSTMFEAGAGAPLPPESLTGR